jgi:multidrug resistance efflux pump
VTGQATVATMVDPTQLRVVGSLDENKGLSSVQVGDAATFTVDAFGGKKYQGVVDEVSPTSNQSDVVFNISDARPTNEFSVYVRFDPTLYPELKNGMSARISIYKQ